uniref:Uncharacterized protein n=1 Tax=Tanacetum cinerariifolium TaxID=118510 RepID=A0A699ITH5_TANCI|nr:hypothetical protein [Tanacetum cinerariifolium]
MYRRLIPQAFFSLPTTFACVAYARLIAKMNRVESFAIREMMESSKTREYPSLIQTYFDTHTVDFVFLRDEERLLYGKQRGHIPGVGRVLARQGIDVLTILEPRCTHTADVDEVKKTNMRLRKEIDMLMKVVRSDDTMFQLLTRLKSQHEVGSGSGSGGGEDDEPCKGEDAGEDEDANGDEDS